MHMTCTCHMHMHMHMHLGLLVLGSFGTTCIRLKKKLTYIGVEGYQYIYTPYYIVALKKRVFLFYFLFSISVLHSLPTPPQAW